MKIMKILSLMFRVIETFYPLLFAMAVLAPSNFTKYSLLIVPVHFAFAIANVYIQRRIEKKKSQENSTANKSSIQEEQILEEFKKNLEKILEKNNIDHTLLTSSETIIDKSAVKGFFIDENKNIKGLYVPHMVKHEIRENLNYNLNGEQVSHVEYISYDEHAIIQNLSEIISNDIKAEDVLRAYTLEELETLKQKAIDKQYYESADIISKLIDEA